MLPKAPAPLYKDAGPISRFSCQTEGNVLCVTRSNNLAVSRGNRLLADVSLPEGLVWRFSKTDRDYTRGIRASTFAASLLRSRRPSGLPGPAAFSGSYWRNLLRARGGSRKSMSVWQCIRDSCRGIGTLKPSKWPPFSAHGELRKIYTA